MSAPKLAVIAADLHHELQTLGFDTGEEINGEDLVSHMRSYYARLDAAVSGALARPIRQEALDLN